MLGQSDADDSNTRYRPPFAVNLALKASAATTAQASSVSGATGLRQPQGHKVVMPSRTVPDVITSQICGVALTFGTRPAEGPKFNNDRLGQTASAF
jgi:hypothetical protein